MLRSAAVIVMLASATAAADTVALLPLDGEARLSIYGQPIAAEIGRALKAEGVDIVVVGPKMDVPASAQLIVDGTITADKKTVTLSIRIRDPHNGTTLETLPSSTATLTTIDKAAAELSGRLVPAVKTHLAALAKAPEPIPPPKPAEPKPSPVSTPPRVEPPPMIKTTVKVARSSPMLDRLVGGLNVEADAWSHTHAGAPSKGVELVLEVLGFDTTPGDVPLARARVHALVVVRGQRVFDRVIRTDTVVGDKGMADEALAQRTAREVLAISSAQLRRLLEGWR